MGFRYEWADPGRTVLALIAEGDWDWKDYHTTLRAAAFSLQRINHKVDMLIDFRQSTREKMPAGLAAHARTFGKKLNANLTGNAIVIGIPAEAEAALGLTAARILPTPDGEAHFVDTLDALRAILHQWREERSS